MLTSLAALIVIALSAWAINKLMDLDELEERKHERRLRGSDREHRKYRREVARLREGR